MKLRIGLTGGIGSGKSMVASVFSLHGIPVYNADLEARRIMNGDAMLQKEISEIFGLDIIRDQQIDRKKLAALVFNNEAGLEKLNALVHPYVLKDFERWEKIQNAPYTIREAAILFETGIWQKLDHTILVDAPEELRIKRVMQRDGRAEAEVRAIFARQWASEKKRALAWRIIENDDHHLVIPQVNSIHNELMYV
jgi:dephospho-CoA kinase